MYIRLGTFRLQTDPEKTRKFYKKMKYMSIELIQMVRFCMADSVICAVSCRRERAHGWKRRKTPIQKHLCGRRQTPMKFLMISATCSADGN